MTQGVFTTVRRPNPGPVGKNRLELLGAVQRKVIFIHTMQEIEGWRSTRGGDRRLFKKKRRSVRYGQIVRDPLEVSVKLFLLYCDGLE